MPTNDEDRVLEVLDDAQCRRLLGTVRVGRLGFTDGALPAILPVAFTLEDDCVRIPARDGNWVMDAVRRSVVAFAVDSYDVADRTGWGVTVIGPAHVVLDAGGAAPDAGFPDGSRPPPSVHSIVVRMGLLRGWRLSHPPSAAIPDARDGGAVDGTTDVRAAADTGAVGAACAGG